MTTTNASDYFDDVSDGAPFTGSYTFNLAQPDNDGFPFGATYNHTTAPYGMTVQIGSRVFRTNPDSVDFIIQLLDDYYGLDYYSVNSSHNLDTDSFAVDNIGFRLEDPTLSALNASTLGLSIQPPDLHQMGSDLRRTEHHEPRLPHLRRNHRDSAGRTGWNPGAARGPPVRPGPKDLPVRRAQRDRKGRRDRRDYRT